MKNSKILASFIFATTLFAVPLKAQAASCTLDGVILDCSANGKSGSEIIDTFGDAGTRDILSNPLEQKTRFKKNGDLEKFRSSMEANWRTIVRYIKQQERQRNAGRLSRAEFKIIAEKFSLAEKSYKTARSFYRQLNWQGLK